MLMRDITSAACPKRIEMIPAIIPQKRFE